MTIKADGIQEGRKSYGSEKINVITSSHKEDMPIISQESRAKSGRQAYGSEIKNELDVEAELIDLQSSLEELKRALSNAKKDEDKTGAIQIAQEIKKTEERIGRLEDVRDSA
jgi:hypothetical protein